MKPEGMSQKAWDDLHRFFARIAMKYGPELLRKQQEREANAKKGASA